LNRFLCQRFMLQPCNPQQPGRPAIYSDVTPPCGRLLGNASIPQWLTRLLPTAVCPFVPSQLLAWRFPGMGLPPSQHPFALPSNEPGGPLGQVAVPISCPHRHHGPPVRRSPDTHRGCRGCRRKGRRCRLHLLPPVLPVLHGPRATPRQAQPSVQKLLQHGFMCPDVLPMFREQNRQRTWPLVRGSHVRSEWTVRVQEVPELSEARPPGCGEGWSFSRKTVAMHVRVCVVRDVRHPQQGDWGHSADAVCWL